MGMVPSGQPPVYWFRSLLALLEGIALLSIAHPWYAATGYLTGSVLISSWWHKHSIIKKCRCKMDLTGRTVLITDGDQGLGKATAMAFARRHANVIIGSKNVESAAQVVKEIKGITGNSRICSKRLDLCDFKSIEDLVEEFYKSDLQLNILINHAEFIPGKKRETTENGCERTMQTNYLGPFLLTSSLVDLMEKSKPGNPKSVMERGKPRSPNKIINLTSMGHQFVSLDLEDLNGSYKYSPLRQYLKSKLACMLLTTELAPKLQREVLTVNSVNPGFVETKSGNATFLQGYIMRIIYFFYGKTPSEAAQSIVHVAISPASQGVSGKYFRNGKERKLPKAAKNKDLAKKLFRLTEDIVDIKF